MTPTRAMIKAGAIALDAADDAQSFSTEERAKMVWEAMAAAEPDTIRIPDCDDPDNRDADFIVSTPFPPVTRGEIDTLSRLWLHEDHAPAIKPGDVFTAPYMARRKWWQLWKPRQWVEERVYKVQETAT